LNFSEFSVALNSHWSSY